MKVATAAAGAGPAPLLPASPSQAISIAWLSVLCCVLPMSCRTVWSNAGAGLSGADVAGLADKADPGGLDTKLGDPTDTMPCDSIMSLSAIQQTHMHKYAGVVPATDVSRIARRSEAC